MFYKIEEILQLEKDADNTFEKELNKTQEHVNSSKVWNSDFKDNKDLLK